MPPRCRLLHDAAQFSNRRKARFCTKGDEPGQIDGATGIALATDPLTRETVLLVADANNGRIQVVWRK
jgi:hypothetical protein